MSNLRGSLLMVASMAGFAFEDVFIKSGSERIPPGEVMMFFGIGGSLIFAVLTWLRGTPLWHPAVMSRPILLRSASEMFGRLFYTLAIALTPLSSASAILQAAPLVVVLGAIVFFKEAVGWRRWLAIATGFVGVLVVLRPGLEGFSLLSLLAVGGMAGFAGRDLATRAAPPVLTNRQLGFYGFAVMIPTGAVLMLAMGGAAIPDGRATIDLICAICFGAAGYYALTAAMRLGEVSIVTPFRYTRLIFALILSVLVFGEHLDAPTLIGSAVIVGAGLYSLLRDNRVRRRAARA